MNTTTTAAAKLIIPADVQEFARQRGLEPYLPSLVAIIKRLFPDATKLDVEVHHDPEIEGLSGLLFEVEVPWDSFEQVRSAQEEWYRETRALCPAALITEFSLSVWSR